METISRLRRVGPTSTAVNSTGTSHVVMGIVVLHDASIVRLVVSLICKEPSCIWRWIALPILAKAACRLPRRMPAAGRLCSISSSTTGAGNPNS